MWNHHPETKKHTNVGVLKRILIRLCQIIDISIYAVNFPKAIFFTWEETKQSIKLKNNVADTSHSLFWLALYVHRESLYNTKCLMALAYYLQYNKEIYINKSS